MDRVLRSGGPGIRRAEDESFEFRTGFTFVEDDLANCSRSDGVGDLLLCPVKINGTLAYKISSKEDMATLLAIAAHEVVHLSYGSHDGSLPGTPTPYGCGGLGQPLEIVQTDRLCPLEVAEEPLQITDVAPGTAFVSFSRRDVLAWKEELGAEKCVAVYGALSPEVRREEARRFVRAEAQYASATDAIGLGVNLPISAVVFTTLLKWNGQEEVRLTRSQIRQIAGRAGRFGLHECGIVSALNERDLKIIREAIKAPCELIPCVAPVAPE
jgi:hypothetical protein